MSKPNLLYGILMVFGLALAYWADLPASDGEVKSVAVLSLDKGLIKKVVLNQEAQTVAVDKLPTQGKFWVTYTKREKKKTAKDLDKDPHGAVKDPAKDPAKDPEKDLAKAHDHANEKTEPEEAELAEDGDKDIEDKGDPKADPEPIEWEVTKEENFLANEKFQGVLDGFNPLEALRIIGVIAEDQHKEFGFLGKEDTLSVTSAEGSVYTFTIGKKSYGSRNRFIRDERDGRVLLIDGKDLEDLERANLRLYERNPINVELEEVTAATLKGAGKEKRLAHTQRNQKGELEWSDDKEGAPVKASYKSYLDKIQRLRITTFASQDDETVLKDQEPFLTVTFEKSSAPLDSMVFKKQPGDKEPTYWVYSNYLSVHAKISESRMSGIEKDIETILAD